MNRGQLVTSAAMNERAPNLFEQQETNRERSKWLVAGFIAFFAWVGFGGDVAFLLLTRDAGASYQHTIPIIGIVTTLVAGSLCWYSWRHGPERVLWATGAWEVIEPATPEQRRFVNVVEEMAIASGLPRPRIWVIPDDDPNAFATGRGPEDASLAVTQGLLHALDRDELQGVVAHEMAHIRNLDTRLMTLLAAMVGAIALMSDGMGRMMGRGGRVFGGQAGRRASGPGEGGGSPLGLIVLVLWLLTLIVAPIVSRLIAMSVSRKREYLADATGAQFTRNPAALAAALEKLSHAAAPTRAITRGAAHLCIVDPIPGAFTSREGFLGDLFASHPPIEQRVTRLKQMAFQGKTRIASANVPGSKGIALT